MIIYAGSGYDGFFKSTDGGSTFKASNSGLDVYPGVRRTVPASADPLMIYVVDQWGVFRSEDAGASWHQTSLRHNVYSLAVDPRNPMRVFAGTDWGRAGPDDDFAGVFITEDGGDHWRPTAGQPELSDFVNAIQIDPSNINRLYAALWSSYPISRSFDGAQSWSRSSTGFLGYGSMALVINPVNPNILYANAHTPPTPMLPPPDVGGVYRSADAGLTWRRFNEGGTPGEDLIAIESDGRFVYSASFGIKGVWVIEVADAAADIPLLNGASRVLFLLALAVVGVLALQRAVQT